MRIALLSAILLPLASAPVFADPGKNESDHHARERAADYREEAAREQRKREREWLREERKRAREWEREHGYGYPAYPVYVPYPAQPVYPPEGIAITRDGISVRLRL